MRKILLIFVVGVVVGALIPRDRKRQTEADKGPRIDKPEKTQVELPGTSQ
jgi:hypothetical protein